MIWNFGDLDPGHRTEADSRFAMVAVPLERTTSYGKGAAGGPAAIVEASRYLELFDEQFGIQAADLGIWTVAPFLTEAETLEANLHLIYSKSVDLLKSGKFVVFAGGEHSLTFPIVRAYREAFPELSVLHLDAHADLRPEYEGSVFSHACVMRRVVDCCPVVELGIRSLSREEHAEIPRLPVTMVYAHQWHRRPGESIQKVLANLSGDVYITFDLDSLDPSLLPATGTPEPGGLSWNDAMSILEQVFAAKNVVGCDVVELAPRADWPASDFVAAKLVYKMMTLHAVYGLKFNPSLEAVR